jgi:hypothetical protein
VHGIPAPHWQPNSSSQAISVVFANPPYAKTNGAVLLHERAAPAPKIAGIPREATLSVDGPTKQSKLLKVVPAGSGVPVARFGGVLVDGQCRYFCVRVL